MKKSRKVDITRRQRLIAGAASASQAPVATPVSFDVNDKAREIEVDTRTTLLNVLREHLQLTGTKKGCDYGQCGACR